MDIKKLSLILLILLFSTTVTAEYFEIRFRVYNDELAEYQETEELAELNKIDIVKNRIGTSFTPPGNYISKLKTGENDVVWKEERFVSFDIEMHGETPEDYGEIEREYADIHIFPSKNQTTRKATKFIVEKEEKTLLEVDLVEKLCETDMECTDYCDYHDAPVIDCTCGDGVCHDWESVDTCPEDCITVPEEEDVEEEPERDLTEIVSDQAVIIILVGFIVATVFYTMKKVEKR